MLSMANTLKYGKQKAICWFLISPDRIRMLIIKWMDRMVSFGWGTFSVLVFVWFVYLSLFLACSGPLTLRLSLMALP